MNVQSRAIVISMKNSAIVSIGVTLINLVVGAPAGYAFARYERYRSLGFALATDVDPDDPALTLAVPFFMIFRRMG